MEGRNCAACGDLSGVDRDGNDVWGASAELFKRHEELKESVWVIGNIDGVRRILWDEGHVDGEQHLIALQLLCQLTTLLNSLSFVLSLLFRELIG